MTKMEKHLLDTKTYWTVCVSGDPLGQTYTGCSYSQKQLKAPGTLPTEAAARRVSKAFKAWILKKYPEKGDPKGEYFVAFADGPCKVKLLRRPESETIRRKNGNHFKDQGEAHQASLALAWLCAKERERFENGVQYAQAGGQERPDGSS